MSVYLDGPCSYHMPRTPYSVHYFVKLVESWLPRTRETYRACGASRQPYLMAARRQVWLSRVRASQQQVVKVVVSFPFHLVAWQAAGQVR